MTVHLQADHAVTCFFLGGLYSIPRYEIGMFDGCTGGISAGRSSPLT